MTDPGSSFNAVGSALAAHHEEEVRSGIGLPPVRKPTVGEVALPCVAYVRRLVHHDAFAVEKIDCSIAARNPAGLALGNIELALR